MTISELESEFPRWAFKAERDGLGWRYVGRTDARRVTIYPVGRLVDQDTIVTEWRVDDGEKSETYGAWLLREGAGT